MGMRRVLFREGEPYMAGTTTYPETYSPDRPAWCWQDEPGVWVIRYAGEHADTICEYGTEPTAERARKQVDMLNGQTSTGRVMASIERDYERCKAAANAQAKQGVLL